MSRYVPGVGPIEPDLMIIGLTPNEILDRLIPYRKVLDNGCWDWLLKKDSGYARVKINGKSYRVIRLICAIYHGLNINNEKELALHKLPCSYESCWNPEHLYVGNHKQNQEDRTRTITHCKNGHPRNVGNSYKHWNRRTKSYMIHCRVCRRKSNV